MSLDRELFGAILDAYINENKKYVLTEKTMSKKELSLKKMFPLYRTDMVEEFNLRNEKTNLGRKYKNGDKILFALLEGDFKENDYTLKIITLTEDEFDKYELVYKDKTNSLHTLKLKK